jgi:hypothetical protein
VRSSSARPMCWRSAPRAAERLVQEGLKWHSDAINRSLPLQKTPSGSIVAMAWTDFVDNRVLRASRRDVHDVS